MANLHRTVDNLALCYSLEFMLLSEINRPTNADLEWWKYDKFKLETLNNDECNAYFRFFKEDIHHLKDVFHIPDQVKCRNNSKIEGIEAFCIMLQQYAYPCRYIDVIKTFARPVPQLCLITGQMTNHIYNMFGRLLTDLDQPWLSPVNLEKYTQAVFEKGAPLINCWGFIDGTVRPVCRPQENQQVLFDGHKRLHSIKFQSLVAANGMIANMHGPIEGRRHDSFMLRESGLLDQLEQMSVDTNNEIMCIYGDPAYPIRPQLQAPFKGNLSPIEPDYNMAMSEMHVSVEWLFADILNFF
ncbi:uncharacterized protein LOC117110643 [Anneissia japonica]|uniref:uncharacterized protein LOC117110643 n=1 Tax=Anneissia japonica TaxID=1529436 RepID=UPI001425824E|nr:uncharacterized protein LOC117110643 [Anneissia japonica]